ncbi:MAG: metallophosphoesterase [Halanaerobiales bacterium]|nr:metallophosphoesterase [Halanaerobiales bacterium]
MLKTEYLFKNFSFNPTPTVIAIYFLFIMVGFFIFLLSSQASAVQKEKYLSYPETKFAVITDTHVFEIINNEKSSLYQKYGAEERKFLRLSTEILERTVEEIIKMDNIDFVILTGDLTDSGDIKSHKTVAKILQRFPENGINIFIIPGNHDGFNTKNYNMKEFSREIVTPKLFREIYNNFGYKQAIYKDNNSLSYVIEPVKDLWFLMIDSCIYNSKENYHVCNGRIRKNTRKWINDILNKASNDNKVVFGAIHHSILEHYKGQQKYFSNYIIDDFEKVSSDFAHQNLNIIFTGHHHAQDIVKKDFDNTSFIYDIETSSLIGYPNAFRVIKINNNEMIVNSRYIKKLPSFSDDFTKYTKKIVRDRVKSMALAKLKKFHLNSYSQEKISSKAADAIIAHYKGNEKAPTSLNIEGLNTWSKFVYSFYKNLLSSLYQDLEPDDLEIKINLKTGDWSSLE